MYNTLTIEGRVFYLVPKEDMDKQETADPPIITPLPKPEIPEQTYINDFMLVGKSGTTALSPEVSPAPSRGEDASGAIPEAQGKPSEYRNKFVNKTLSQRDVLAENTANLSSLKKRNSTFDGEGKEAAFDEVSR